METSTKSKCEAPTHTKNPTSENFDKESNDSHDSVVPLNFYPSQQTTDLESSSNTLPNTKSKLVDTTKQED